MILIVWCGSKEAYAQSALTYNGKINDLPYVENNIKKILTYDVDIKDTTKRRLVSIIYLNSWGYTKKSEFFRNDGTLKYYNLYSYEQDSFLRSVYSYSGHEELEYFTEFEYDKLGRKSKQRTIKNGELTIKQSFKWNKKNDRVIENSEYIKKNIRLDEEGRITSIVNKPRRNYSEPIYKWETKYENDHEYTKVYFDKKSKDYVSILTCRDGQNIENNTDQYWHDLDFSEPLRIGNGDFIEKQFFYSDNGLMLKKMRHLNGQVNAIYLYKYGM